MSINSTKRLCFYVPNYESVRNTLNNAYTTTGVVEWSAEPGRVNETDADVVVRGSHLQVASFKTWLLTSKIAGACLEGARIIALHAPFAGKENKPGC